MDQLSNYELLDLLTTYGSDGAGHFMNFLTVFSAFLVAGYILAGKLGRTTLLQLIACVGSILFAFHTDKEARKRDA